MIGKTDDAFVKDDGDHQGVRQQRMPGTIGPKGHTPVGHDDSLIPVPEAAVAILPVRR